MVLDKALLLKGLAGVAALGGTVGGGIVYKSLSSSKKEAKEKPEDPNSNKEKLQGDQNPTDIKQEDELGLSIACESSKECDITDDNIKKVKFKELEGEGEVTVSPNSNLNITLTIKGENETKRYIFENGGTSEVTLTKGSATLKLPVGKTRFTKENENKLKKLDVGNYGLPTRCTSSKPCPLIDDDLEQIKFSDFTEGESTVDNFTTNQTITLTIENNKYIFTNNSSTSVAIKNGSTTVDLDQGETDFTVADNKLKKVELWDFGLPQDCRFDDGSTPKTCKLGIRDLKKIKFKDIGNSPTVSGLSGDQKIDLKIEKIEDSSYPDKRKYIFTPGASNDVTISGTSETITLTKGEENTFKKENDYLVNVPKKEGPSFETTELDGKINGLGLPSSCTFAKKASGTEKSIECELSKDELKKLKFSVGDITSTTGGHGDVNSDYGDPKTYKIKIEDSGEEDQFKDKKIMVTFLNGGENRWSSDLTIIGSAENENTMIITNNSNTEFKINSQNKLEKAWKESTLSALVGLKCPKEDGGSDANCTLKDADGSIKVFIDNQSKDFKPTNSADIENNICFKEDEYNQGIKFKVKNKISGTNKNNSNETLELEVDSYEIKRIDGQGWRFAKKSNSH